MSILSFVSSLILAPLQSVVVFFAPHAATPRAVPRPIAHPTEAHAVQAKPYVVRVLRSVEQGMPPGRAGRMVISGRFADVCAELDRLAEREMVMAS
jgi:hypothetical protein